MDRCVDAHAVPWRAARGIERQRHRPSEPDRERGDRHGEAGQRARHPDVEELAAATEQRRQADERAERLQLPQEAMIRDMGRYGFDRIACNHCTGLPAVELMTALGYPIVRGTGNLGSISDLYIGNGDSVTSG
jgi:hypothetical protein